MNKKNVIIGWVISIAQLIVTILSLVMVYMSKMFPMATYAFCVVFGVILFVLVRVLLSKINKKALYITGVVIGIIITLLLAALSYYFFGFVKTLMAITNNNIETTVYGVYVLKDDTAESMEDAKGYSFGYMSGTPENDLELLKKDMSEDLGETAKLQSCHDLFATIDDLKEHTVQAIVMNEAMLDIIEENDVYKNLENDIREIASYDVEKDVAVVEKNLNDTFTVFISGIDVSGPISTTSRSDVNILGVVNPNTHQILLINTPRDYYVPLSVSGGAKDKLTHAGIYGINASMDTLAMLYNTDVDYYFRINFTGFKSVIDALGGVTVNSDYAFSAQGCSFSQGANRLNSTQALAFARERHAFSAGDNQRGKNQMAVIAGVINEMQSPAILNNYGELLSGLEGSFQTNIPYSMVSSMVSDQLSASESWNVVTYAVTGSGDKNTTYSMPNQLVYVMNPNYSTVEKAEEYIDKIENNEIVTID